MTMAGPNNFRVLLPALISRIDAPRGARIHLLSGETMTTTWAVRIAGGERLDVDALRAHIQQVLATVVAQMSPWEINSDISRFNRSASGTWQRLPREFCDVMRCALEIAEKSGGAFDPTAGSAVNAWGFGTKARFDRPNFVPPRSFKPSDVEGNWAQLRLEDDSRLFQPGGVTLTLAAIAKGYAVDAVSALLSGLGYAHHLVEIGGELRGSGFKPDHQPWWVEVEPPEAEALLPAMRIALHGLSVATSGDYRRFVTVDGRQMQHTIDPRTRRPVEHDVAAVTVVHESCMRADAWATAMMVLGAEAGLQLATDHKLAVVFRQRGDRGCWSETASPALLAMQD